MKKYILFPVYPQNPICSATSKLWSPSQGLGHRKLCRDRTVGKPHSQQYIYIIIFYLCISGNPQKGVCVCKIIIIIIFHLYISCLSSQQERCLCPWLALLGGLTQAKCAGISSLAQM